ncbi:AraC family transcriptional regulator [Herbaspirillum sp. BH-1]|uniref:AraC family ethanolamine operon transcriptional activator n=1 Tax=Herbaspirillum frisingense TaxID=92645 RepID=A0ABU1P9F3_9BURK|nr:MULTISPECIES: helix-turn-helix domain-containing protein [Herbaspirillum]MDR6582549.1 AraC family ethanolamine operon transcriptional activator [Herbaspirillum frisingense]PLY59748.1 AraC family transcriptional regulator [Herbaspirillum sp. BH-1]
MSSLALSQPDTVATHSRRALRTAVARDVDEHAHNLTDWEQRYDQLACGSFEGVLQEWQSEGLQIFREAGSRAVRQSCQVWPDAYWFGIEVRTMGMRINGRLVPQDVVMTRPGACEFELVTPDQHDIFGVVVQRDALQASAGRLGCQPDWRRLGQAEMLKVDAGGLDDCRHQIGALLALAGQASGQAAHAALQLRQEAVLVSLLALLDEGDIEAEAGASLLRRRRIVNDARDLALAHQESPVTVPMLCEALHVSRRTLQYCFEDVLGVSPMSYLRLLRLNGVRRALAQGDGRQPIGDIAAAWGFSNFSQFSCDYKKLFGQSPSAMLQARTSH